MDVSPPPGGWSSHYPHISLTTPSFGSRPPEHAQLFGMRNSQPVQQHVLRRGEDDRVRANPQRQRSHGDRRKAWALCQHAQTHSADRRAVRPTTACPTPAGNFLCRQPNSPAPRAPGAWLPHAACPTRQVLGIALDMESQLLIERCVQIRSARYCAPPRRNPAEQAHRCSAAVLRIDPITSAKWFHFFASASSLFRPAAVRR